MFDSNFCNEFLCAIFVLFVQNQYLSTDYNWLILMKVAFFLTFGNLNLCPIIFLETNQGML